MLYHTATWTQHADPAQRQAQMDFALALAAYAAAKFPDANIQILANINTPHAYWFDTHESLGAWEAANEELNQDKGWQTMMAKGTAEGLVPPDISHHFFKVVST